MAKTKISEFSSTPANNTDIDSINIAEGCAPSGINDAIRELMAQLKDFQTGAQGDSFNGPIGTSTAAAGAFTTLSATGAITSTLATGTAPLVIASTTKVANLNVDLLDGADWASPAALGSTTPAAVSATTLSASSTVTLSGGTANGVAYLNGSKVVTSGSALTFDGNNLTQSGASAAVSLLVNTTNASVSASNYSEIQLADVGTVRSYWRNMRDGSGATIFSGNDHIRYALGGSEQMRLTSTGLGIGTSSPTSKLTVSGAISASGTIYRPDSGFLQWNSTGASGGTNRAIIWADSSSNLFFGTGAGNSTQATLDSSGNLGLGVTPSAWETANSVRALQFNGGSVFSYSNAYLFVGQNFYRNSGGVEIYINTAAATKYQQAFGAHQWYNAPSGTAGDAITFTQAMTLDASGNLGVGATSSLKKLTVQGSTADRTVEVIDNGSNDAAIMLQLSGVQEFTLGVDRTDSSFKISDSGALGTNDRLVIDSSGYLLVGTTSRLGGGSYGNHQIQASQGSGGAAALVVYNNSGVDNSVSINAIKSSATTTSSQRFIQFYADAGATAMGGIVGNGASNVQFAAISDAREKTNVQPISGSLEKISALNPVEFDWIKSGEHVNSGFIAQDVEQVFPEFVVENMSGEGEESRKGLTGGMTSGIIPHLVKAIQEQQAIINSLKARLDAANL